MMKTHENNEQNVHKSTFFLEIVEMFLSYKPVIEINEFIFLIKSPLGRNQTKKGKLN